MGCPPVFRCPHIRKLDADRIRKNTSGYPRQFWTLFWGQLINSAGNAMVWPFLTVYMREHLAVPLTTITLLCTFNSVAGVLATSIAGPIVDRFGRKSVMVLSMLGSCLVFLAATRADTLAAWAVLMAALGVIWTLYRVGADAMVADMLRFSFRQRFQSRGHTAGMPGHVDLISGAAPAPPP